MRGEMNSNQYEISFRLKVSFRCSVSSLFVFTWVEAKWNSNRYGFHIRHLDRNEISNWHAIFMWTKWISVNSLDMMSMCVWNSLRSFWQKWNLPRHVHQNIRSFWNAAEMKRHVSRTCFHAGLKSQTGMSSSQGCFVLKINRRADTIASNIWLNNWCFLHFFL